MDTVVVGIFHVIVAVVLIILVLIQDSKSDGALGIGGSSGSNSLLGATGAQTLASKLTVFSAAAFAITCLVLSVMTARSSKSVVDSMTAPATPVQAPASVPAVDATANSGASPSTPPASK